MPTKRKPGFIVRLKQTADGKHGKGKVIAGDLLDLPFSVTAEPVAGKPKNIKISVSFEITNAEFLNKEFERDEEQLKDSGYLAFSDGITAGAAGPLAINKTKGLEIVLEQPDELSNTIGWTLFFESGGGKIRGAGIS